MADDLYVPIDDDLRSALRFLSDDMLMQVQHMVDQLEGEPEAQRLIVMNIQRSFDMVMTGAKRMTLWTLQAQGMLTREVAEVFDVGEEWPRAENQLRPGNADAPRLEATRNDRRHMR